jgi:hypothetical protein
MQEIEIVKWIIRVDESKPRDRANLIGLDREGNEYTFQTRYYEGGEWHDAPTDIICTTKPSTSA